ASGNAFVSGMTESDESTFPVTVGPDLTFGGVEDGFVGKIEADGSGFIYLGYIGGADGDEGGGIAIDSHCAADVSGTARSDEMTFPVVDGPDLTENGGIDIFVSKIEPDGSAFNFLGYVGGDNTDEGFGIALDSAGSVYVSGHSASTETTFPVLVGPD